MIPNNKTVCQSCKHRASVPGDAHIQCKAPLPQQVRIDASGEHGRELAALILDKGQRCVVRCVWPGSGAYPWAFDENTVCGCANREAKE